MTTRSITGMLGAAYKAITTSSLGDSILVPQQRDRFIAAMEDRAPMLRLCRRITMTSHQTNLDRWTLGRVLDEPAAEGETFTGSTTPDTDTNKLNATKARGRVPVSDEAATDSLARGNLPDQLVALIGRGAGRDLEELLVAGDTGESGFIGLINGWLTKAGNLVEGDPGAGDPDFDPEDVEDMFQAQLLTIPPRFLTDRSRMRFWVPFDIEDAYRDKLRARGTEMGDRAQIGDGPIAYKGIRLQEVPAMPAGTSLLSSQDNTVYGIWQDIGIEPERVASADRTDYHVRVRADAHFEEEDGAVVAEGYTGPTE